MPPSKDELWLKFETAGEAKVRENLAAKRYGEQKEPMAREWLREQEEKRKREATKRGENSQERQIKVSRGQNRATWFLVAATILAAVLIVAFAT